MGGKYLFTSISIRDWSSNSIRQFVFVIDEWGECMMMGKWEERFFVAPLLSLDLFRFWWCLLHMCLLVISVCCGLLSFCLALELLLATWSDCAVGTRTFGKIIDYSYFNCVSWFTKNGISFVFLGTKIRIFIVLFWFFSLASSHWTGFGCLESRRSCLFWFWMRCILGHVFLFKLHSSWRSALMKWLDYLEVPFLELSVLGDRLCQANSSRAYKTTAVWQLG